MCVHQLSAISVTINCFWVEHNKLFFMWNIVVSSMWIYLLERSYPVIYFHVGNNFIKNYFMKALFNAFFMHTYTHSYFPSEYKLQTWYYTALNTHFCPAKLEKKKEQIVISVVLLNNYELMSRYFVLKWLFLYKCIVHERLNIIGRNKRQLIWPWFVLRGLNNELLIFHLISSAHGPATRDGAVAICC